MTAPDLNQIRERLAALAKPYILPEGVARGLDTTMMMEDISALLAEVDRQAKEIERLRDEQMDHELSLRIIGSTSTDWRDLIQRTIDLEGANERLREDYECLRLDTRGSGP